MTEMTDEDLQEFVDMTTNLLHIEYLAIAEVTDSMMSLIDATARLVEIHHIRFDGEFKTICWMWEIKHDQK